MSGNDYFSITNPGLKPENRFWDNEELKNASVNAAKYADPQAREVEIARRRAMGLGDDFTSKGDLGPRSPSPSASLPPNSSGRSHNNNNNTTTTSSSSSLPSAPSGPSNTTNPPTNRSARRYPCPYPGCTKGGNTPSYRDRHYRHVHQGLRPFACPHCSHAFSDIRHRDRHVNTNVCGMVPGGPPHPPRQVPSQSHQSGPGNDDEEEDTDEEDEEE